MQTRGIRRIIGKDKRVYQSYSELQKTAFKGFPKGITKSKFLLYPVTHSRPFTDEDGKVKAKVHWVGYPNTLDEIRAIEEIIPANECLDKFVLRFKNEVKTRLKPIAHGELEKVVPSYKKLQELKQLWTNFLNIYDMLPESETDEHATKLDSATKGWAQLFVKIYQANDVTPYIHVFANHLGECIRRHGNLVKYNQQRFEYSNNELTASHFRGSNHSNAAWRQVLERHNRIVYFQPHKVESNANACTCCKTVGHKRTNCLHRRVFSECQNIVL